jgi:poly-gamma-glutamate capsule biosynthesis protein CapA/YwtB (metallophosphatase superfamily)
VTRTARLAVAAALVTICAAVGVPASAAPAPTVTFAFVGDTILGDTPQVPSDPQAYLAPVAQTLRTGSDVVFANFEGTLTSGGTSKCPNGSTSTCYAFRNPTSFARAFAGTGFGVLNLANNHSYDYGASGLTSTKRAITDAGMAFTGLPGQITYAKRHGVHIAFVAFAPYGRTNNLLDLSAAARLIRRAHSQAGIVVVYMHAGAEGTSADHVTGGEEHYAGEDRGNPKRFAHMAVDNGADLVVASGPHVLRGMEFYKNRLIAYSLGDFANYHNFSSDGSLSRSLVLHVTLGAHGAFKDATLTSIQLARGGRATVGGDSLGFVSSLSRHDFGAHAARITKDGRVLAP